MLRAAAFLLLIFSSVELFAQSGEVRGIVVDTSLHQPITEATVTVMSAADSSLVTFTRTDEHGAFALKGIANGSYRLLITHVAYNNLSFHFNITASARSLTLGNLPLSSKAKLLQEVTVLQEAPPVTIRKDTIEYNAGSFKTKPNGVVEDLLKKLPGLQVDKDGKVKANGEEVKRVLVDGKPFFGNDPKTATKNLPGDIVDKVQVFDKKSEQSAFTGFDDGNSEKTINLTLKQDKKNGLFGRATAAAGNKSRYQGNVNLNQFDGERQLSMIGMSNNLNKQGFSFSDILDFSGGLNSLGQGGGMTAGGLPIQGTSNNAGVSTTTAGGFNYNDRWNSKFDFNGSYFYNNINTGLQQQSLQQWLLPGNNFVTEKTLTSRQVNESHRANVVSDSRIDSMNSLRYTSSVNYQQSRSVSNNGYVSRSSKGGLLNEGYADAASSGDGYNWDNSLLYRHKFNKKGRTISATVNFSLNEVGSEGSIYSRNNFYEPAGQRAMIDTINQHYGQSGKTTLLQGTLSYTEPLSKKTLLEANYSYGNTTQFSAKQTFDFDAFTSKHSMPNEELTNAFRNSFTNHRGTVNLRTQQKKYNYSIGLALQHAQLMNDFHLRGRDSGITRTYLNLLPNANLQYDFNKYRNIRLLYNTYTRPPSVTELQPVPDNTDPLNIKLGNPDLTQEYSHLLRMNFLSFDPFRRTNLFASLNLRLRQNAIVYADEVSPTGSRISRPVNADGLYNLNGNISWGFPARWAKSNITLNTCLAQSRNIGFLNGVMNRINHYGFTQEISWNFFHKEIIDLVAGSAFSYNASRYALGNNRNNDYTTRTQSLELNLYLPGGFSFATDMDYINRRGLSDGYNNQPLIWNAGFAKQLMKHKQAELRLQVFDLLNQNNGINRNSNQNYIEDISYNVLNRYFLLSFTYNISRFAGKSMPAAQQREVQMIRM
jgi:hypothetical protein